ncbi:MAG: hypothetical protein C1943_14110 [Halochromatium sp.]|nr:hypothetical protein [Halochromatium sp.]
MPLCVMYPGRRRRLKTMVVVTVILLRSKGSVKGSLNDYQHPIVGTALVLKQDVDVECEGGCHIGRIKRCRISARLQKEIKGVKLQIKEVEARMQKEIKEVDARL